MAFDDTPPRTGIIAGLALLAFITLGVLEFVFRAYFAHEVAKAYEWSVSEPYELNALRNKQLDELHRSGIGIHRAIAMCAVTDRAQLPSISPKPSTDADPIKGWMHAPPERDPWVPMPKLTLPTAFENRTAVDQKPEP